MASPAKNAGKLAENSSCSVLIKRRSPELRRKKTNPETRAHLLSGDVLTTQKNDSNLPTGQLYCVTESDAGGLRIKPNKMIKHQKNKYLTFFLLLQLGAFMMLAGCSQKDATPPAPRPALIYKITSGSGVDSDVYAGEIRARIEADHAFRVGGKIAQRLVDIGAVVHKGQPLAQLDPQDVKLAADAAAAQVAAQQTDADFADAELKRYKDLFTKGFVSQSALDLKISAASAAKARLDALRAQANVSLNQSGYTTLHAEMDGVVTQILAEAGQVVAQGQPVMKIANPREKELAISAAESRVDDFRRAMNKTAPRELRIATWSQPEKYFQARIREIGAAADAATRTYPVRVTIVDPDESIQLGMSAYAVFVGANAPGVMAVPLSALYVLGEKTGVWQVAPDGKISLKPVSVVQFRETAAIIKAGPDSVKPGDSIIAAGVHKLREGEVVKPVSDPLVTGDGKVAMAPSGPDGVAGDAVASLKRPLR